MGQNNARTGNLRETEMAALAEDLATWQLIFIQLQGILCLSPPWASHAYGTLRH